MAKDPYEEALRRSREAHELRIKMEREQKQADKAINFLQKNVSIDEHEAKTKAAEKAVENGPPEEKKTQAQLLEEEGQKLRGFKRRGRGRSKDKGRDFGR
ncbi:MAG: hypothetical protein P1U69_13835 [Parvibaculaceae bacterium]|nr:hypothetical protein [Parvibaculaceae bacterium]|tara:strand:+ start:5227 stop:5526 length:300 start_codon:yes stop_codon:yes gene_type:complete